MVFRMMMVLSKVTQRSILEVLVVQKVFILFLNYVHIVVYDLEEYIRFDIFHCVTEFFESLLSFANKLGYSGSFFVYDEYMLKSGNNSV